MGRWGFVVGLEFSMCGFCDGVGLDWANSQIFYNNHTTISVIITIILL